MFKYRVWKSKPNLSMFTITKLIDKGGVLVSNSKVCIFNSVATITSVIFQHKLPQNQTTMNPLILNMGALRASWLWHIGINFNFAVVIFYKITCSQYFDFAQYKGSSPASSLPHLYVQ